MEYVAVGLVGGLIGPVVPILNDLLKLVLLVLLLDRVVILFILAGREFRLSRVEQLFELVILKPNQALRYVLLRVVVVVGGFLYLGGTCLVVGGHEFGGRHLLGRQDARLVGLKALLIAL